MASHINQLAPVAAATGEADTPEVPLPAPGEVMASRAYIKPLRRERDRQSMSFAFDPALP